MIFNFDIWAVGVVLWWQRVVLSGEKIEVYLSILFNYAFRTVGRGIRTFYPIADCWKCLWNGVVVSCINFQNRQIIMG